MRGKLMFLGGLAVGYVVGTRAGREQYDRLVSAARELWDHPTVQEAAGVVQAQANRLYAEGRDTVTEKLSHTRVGERLSHPERANDPAARNERDKLAGTGNRPPDAASS